MNLEVNEPSAKYFAKAGYKRTDIGFMPDSWEVKPLGSIASISSGGTPSRDRADYWDGDIPWITTSQVDFSRIQDAEQFISRAGLQNSAAKILPQGTLLLALYGQGKTRGKVGILGIEAATNQACAAIEVARDVSPDFLLHFLASQYDSIRGMSNGGSQDNLNSGIVKSILVPVPSPAEQCVIAAALSDVDALIAGLERLIAKKRDIKQATMQQLLTGQTRLPGFSGKWNRAELKCLVSTPITDGPHMTPRFYDVGVPFLSVNNLVDNRIDLSDLRYISKEDDLVFARKCKPKVGDVLLGKAASVGKVAIVEEDFDFNIWSPIALVRAGDAINAKFLYYQLLSADCASQIALLTNSSSQGNIGMGDIERLEISYPAPDEQTAIATVLSDMDAELLALEARLTKTRAIKQGMMQELLTGRTRLV